MTLTSEEIAAIIGVLVVLGNAFAVYLSHRSTGKNIDMLHEDVHAVIAATNASPPDLALVDGHATPPVQPLPPRG